MLEGGFIEVTYLGPSKAKNLLIKVPKEALVRMKMKVIEQIV